MKKNIKLTFFLTLVAAIAVWFVAPVAAQDNMQILRDKIKADKKLVVAANMDLTESEAKGFWPVYEEYQKDLASINQRIGKLIESYATDYRAGTITDEKAKTLIDELVGIEHVDGALQQSYAPKLLKALELAANPNLTLEIIAVDRNKDDGGGLAKKNGLKRIPTVILLADGKELGRIIERPTTSMEGDFAAISTKRN